MTNQPVEPKQSNQWLRKLFWLLCGFAPSAIAIGCFRIKDPGRWLAPTLLLFGLGCSLASAIGLTRGVKDALNRSFLCVCLVIFFLVSNVFITVYAGCSGMGRISP